MMNHKLKIASVFCIGAAAAIFIANAPPQHQRETAPPPQIRPVCDFVQRGKDVTLTANPTAGVEPVLPESGTLTPFILDAAPEPQVIAKSEEPHAPEPPPATQEQTTSPPTAEPQMGDTRIVDGQKQVYFLGFGWIEDNDTPNEGVYAENMYENGNKVGSMGGGTFVDSDGDGDINKMVGIMGGGEVGRSCGDINKIVGSMD